jgi:hypothetical protein
MTGTKATPSLSAAAWFDSRSPDRSPVTAGFGPCRSAPARSILPEGEMGRNKSAQNGPAFVPRPRDYGLARAGKPAEKARH